MHILNNPELKRNLWLELTPHRLFMMPLVIFGILLISILAGSSALDTVHHCLNLLFILLVFGGPLQSGTAISSEISQNTWYQQRLSAQTPLNLLTGKLLGSTIFYWYGGLFCAIGALFYSGFSNTGILLYFAALGLLAQSFSFYANLLTIKMQTRFICAISGYFMAMFFYNSKAFDSHANLLYLALSGSKMQWFDFSITSGLFSLVSLLLAIAWTLKGCHSLLRKELHFQNNIVTWTLFMLFLMVYIGGLSFNETFKFVLKHQETLSISSISIKSILVALIPILYAVLFYEKQDLVTYRKFFAQLKSRFWVTAFTLTPRWYISLKFIAALILIDTYLHLSSGQAIDTQVVNFYALLCGLIIRDIGLSHYFKLIPSGNRTNATVISYLMILYILVPSLLYAANQEILSAAFLPYSSTTHNLSIVINYLIAFGAWVLVYFRFKSTPLRN